MPGSDAAIVIDALAFRSRGYFASRCVPVYLGDTEYLVAVMIRRGLRRNIGPVTDAKTVLFTLFRELTHG